LHNLYSKDGLVIEFTCSLIKSSWCQRQSS